MDIELLIQLEVSGTFDRDRRAELRRAIKSKVEQFIQNDLDVRGFGLPKFVNAKVNLVETFPVGLGTEIELLDEG